MLVGGVEDKDKPPGNCLSRKREGFAGKRNIYSFLVNMTSFEGRKEGEWSVVWRED